MPLQVINRSRASPVCWLGNSCRLPHQTHVMVHVYLAMQESPYPLGSILISGWLCCWLWCLLCSLGRPPAWPPRCYWVSHQIGYLCESPPDLSLINSWLRLLHLSARLPPNAFWHPSLH